MAALGSLLALVLGVSRSPRGATGTCLPGWPPCIRVLRRAEVTVGVIVAVLARDR
ncbi:hypothetical protein GCM10023094_48610 [Rhodococcus olei]|uniref:Uncharacterized protein n=1 Tax=Rhodococcus olei TaxID=2161675 RepID=A0ABP8PJG4_9NOCA